MDDDLGSFFAEIEEVEKIHQDEKTEVKSNKRQNDNDDEENLKKRKINDLSSSSSSVSVSSKPVSYVAASSQPVKFSSQANPVSYSAPPLSSSLSSSYTSAPLSSSLSSLTSAPSSSTSTSSVTEPSKQKHVRKAGDTLWVDNTLSEWPENDFRIFVGNLGKEITTDLLTKHFQPLYKSFVMAKVIRDGPDNKSKGYGFVSFLDSMDCLKAMKEQNNKYIGSRPMAIKRSTWKDRELKEVNKKDSKKKKMLKSFGLA